MCVSTSYQLTCTRRRLARRAAASMLDLFCLFVWFGFGSIALFIICVEQRFVFLTIYGVIEVVGLLAARLDRVS